MPPDTHIEMLNAEAERLPEPPKETGPNPEALALAAADLGRRLVWLPGSHSPRFFSERYRALCRALKPVLRDFQGPPPKSDSGRRFSLAERQPPPAACRSPKHEGRLQVSAQAAACPHAGRCRDSAHGGPGRGILGHSWLRFQRELSGRLCAGFSAEHGVEAGRAVGAGSGAEAGPAGRDRGPRIESRGGSRRLLRGRRLRAQPARHRPHVLERRSRADDPV